MILDLFHLHEKEDENSGNDERNIFKMLRGVLEMSV